MKRLKIMIGFVRKRLKEMGIKYNCELYIFKEIKIINLLLFLMYYCIIRIFWFLDLLRIFFLFFCKVINFKEFGGSIKWKNLILRLKVFNLLCVWCCVWIVFKKMRKLSYYFFLIVIFILKKKINMSLKSFICVELIVMYFFYFKKKIRIINKINYIRKIV